MQKTSKRMNNELFEDEELAILSEQLDFRDMYVLGFLKGANRNVMKKMSHDGLFNVNYKL